MLCELRNKNTKQTITFLNIDKIDTEENVILAMVKQEYCRTFHINNDETELLKVEE